MRQETNGPLAGGMPHSPLIVPGYIVGQGSDRELNTYKQLLTFISNSQCCSSNATLCFREILGREHMIPKTEGPKIFPTISGHLHK